MDIYLIIQIIIGVLGFIALYSWINEWYLDLLDVLSRLAITLGITCSLCVLVEAIKEIATTYDLFLLSGEDEICIVEDAKNYTINDTTLEYTDQDGQIFVTLLSPDETIRVTPNK